MSINTMSGLLASAFLITSAPSSASSMTSKPDCFSSRLARPFLKSVWSSANNRRMGFIRSLLSQRQPNNNHGAFFGSAVDANFPAHGIRSISHGLKTKMVAVLRDAILREALSVIFDTYCGIVVVSFYRDPSLRRASVFDNVSQSLVDYANELDLYLRRKFDRFGIINFEFHWDFSDLAKIL